MDNGGKFSTGMEDVDDGGPFSQCESDFMLQRVSLAILRGNAFSILQSHSD